MPDVFSDEEIGLTPLSDEDIGLKQLAADELKRNTFEAKIEGQQAKALSALTDIGTEAAKGVVRAFSYIDPTGFSQGLMNQYGVEPVHVIPPEKVLPDVQTVSEFTREGLQNIGVDPNVVLPEQYRKPVEEFAAENIAALPEMAPLMTAGVAAPKPVARVFQAQMLRNVPEAAYQAATAPTPEERVKAGLSAGAGLAFPALIEHGIRERPTPIPDIPGSRLEQQRGALPAQPEAAPIERATPEQAAAQAEQMVARFEEKPATEPSILAPEKPEVAPTAVPMSQFMELKGPTKLGKKPIPAGTIVKILGDVEGVGVTVEFPGGKTGVISKDWLRSVEQVQPKEVAPVEKPVEEPAKETKAEVPSKGTITFETYSEPTGNWEPQRGAIVVSKSTIPGDKPWRATVFGGSADYPTPIAHIQLDKPSDLNTPKSISELGEQLGRYTRKISIEPIEKAVENIKRSVKSALEKEQLSKAAESKPAEPLSDEQIGLTPKIETADKPMAQWEDYLSREAHKASSIASQTEGGRGIAAGSGNIEYRWKEGAMYDLRDALRQGKTLDEAAEIAKQKSKEAIRKHNQRRPKDFNWQRWDESAYRYIDTAVNDLKALERGEIDVTGRLIKPAEAPVEAVTPSKLEQLTAKVESGQKLTASEKKQYLKLRQEATGTAPEAEKPIVGMGGAAIGETNPKTQIEQLTETAQGIVPKKLPLGERFKQDVDLNRKREILAEGATKAISALRDTWNGIKNRWNGIENVDDLLREKGKLSAEIETRGWRVRKFESEMKKAVPSKRDRAAISKWVDAGGDPEVLKRGALETKPEYRQAYIDALDLRGDLLTTAQNARNYFEARLNEAIDAGVLKEGVEDYIHRVYESRPEVAKKVFANVQTGLLQRNPNLAKKRVFDFDFEAEKLGYKPVQSFIDRIALYESSLSKAIAAREFIKKATEMKADDGRPVIDIKGVGIPVENAEGVREGTLIKPKFNPQLNNEPGSPNYRGDYVNKEFPSLSRWKWVSTDAGGKPIFVQGDVAIHPDFVHRINALLEPSRLRYGRYSKITKPMLDVGSAVKQTMLDLSGFHQVQITAHGLEHKVLPWKIVKDIDFNNPNVEGLLKGGITLGGDYRAAYKEGLVGNSITRHVPWLGPVLESYHQWLFQSYIPRIKMTMALQALERNRIRYGKTMTDEQIMHKTASQANSAFGELNYIMLERSKTTQDIARLILLAPDFLEARGRFAGEAFTKGGESKVPGFGNEQRAALLLGALTMYVTARIANKIVDDQYHFEPENAFSLVYKGHAYSLRTVQGDILHLIEKPLQFWLNRLNPVYGRTMLEIVTGRDYFGRKRSVPEVLWDSVKNVMPISLRNSRERKLWESMMNSFGVNARRYNATDDAFKLANAWKEKNGIQERGEFIYDAEKDPLRGLKIALSQEDDAGAAKEIKKIFDSKVYDRKRLDAYFKRYASMPFTGSKANDIKFINSLNEDERKTVEAAKQHKRDMLKLYDQALQKYYAALRTPIQ